MQEEIDGMDRFARVVVFNTFKNFTRPFVFKGKPRLIS